MDIWAKIAVAIVITFFAILAACFFRVFFAIWPELLTKHIYPFFDRMADRLHDFSENLNNKEERKREQEHINYLLWRAKVKGTNLPTIKTFCEKCAMLYGASYKVKKIGFNTTTEKKKKCEHCGVTGRFVLAQYLIDKKSGES